MEYGDKSNTASFIGVGLSMRFIFFFFFHGMVCRYGSSAPPIQAFSVLVWTQLATLHYSQCFCHCWWNSHSLHSEGMPFALYILNNNNNNFFLKKSALLSFVWQAERMPKITQPALYLLPPQNIYLYNYNISMISPFGGIIIYNKLFHLSTTIHNCQFQMPKSHFWSIYRL